MERGADFRGCEEGTLLFVMGAPGPCPACESVDLERRGGKDMCPRCHYIQPCCDGGYCAV